MPFQFTHLGQAQLKLYLSSEREWARETPGKHTLCAVYWRYEIMGLDTLNINEE